MTLVMWGVILSKNDDDRAITSDHEPNSQDPEFAAQERKRIDHYGEILTGERKRRVALASKPDEALGMTRARGEFLGERVGFRGQHVGDCD